MTSRIALLAALSLVPLVAVMSTLNSAQAVERSIGPREVAKRVVLPGDATTSTASSRTWLVAGKPGRHAARIARLFDARPVHRSTAIFEVPIAQARPMVRALRRARALSFAEPNLLRNEYAYPQDPFYSRQWWLPAVVSGGVTPPVVTSESPSLAVIDDPIDVTHAEFQGGNAANLATATLGGPHGTQVAGVAGASANGTGITGVWPGMRLIGSPVMGLTCYDAARAVLAAVDAGASVINMSYGFRGYCRAHHVATNLAFGSGVALVAAAGNDYAHGNNANSTPAADPHVVTVAALDRNLSTAPFSNANATVDVSAPGIDILTTTPTQFDDDGVRDGYSTVSGTSFSAPIVAAATAWVRAARPALDQTQITDLIRYSAEDLGGGGWDPDYGFGLVRVDRALQARAPHSDPLEPNDDIPWINGSRFTRPDPAIWRGGRRISFSARLDTFEDAVDVYRAIVPPKSRFTIALRPRGGNVDLEVYAAGARTVYRTRGRVAYSYRPGRRFERLRLFNPGRTRRLAYIVAFVPPRSRTLDPAYRLSIRRGR